jgi:hypothetical protein
VRARNEAIKAAGGSPAPNYSVASLKALTVPTDDPELMTRSELLAALGLANSDLSDSELADRLKAKRG